MVDLLLKAIRQNLLLASWKAPWAGARSGTAWGLGLGLLAILPWLFAGNSGQAGLLLAATVGIVSGLAMGWVRRWC